VAALHEDGVAGLLEATGALGAHAAAGDLLGGRPTLLWALALERLTGTACARLQAAAARAREADGDPRSALAEARSLYEESGVVPRALEIAQKQRRRAAEAVAGCRLRRLRDVLEFLLDLAVPEQPTYFQ
jgi:geranylgeranyl pyrophosphate synthase